MQLGVRVKQYVTLGHICPTVCLYFDFKPNSRGLWVFVETQELNLRLLGWICAFWAGFEHPGLELNLSFGACKLQVPKITTLARRAQRGATCNKSEIQSEQKIKKYVLKTSF